MLSPSPSAELSPGSTGTTRFPLPHMPGLDGLRGIAVLAVLAYHLDLIWAGGGFLGVEVFFTLSGFLITQLLVGEMRARGRVGLAAFVRARARRLLPALVACVLATGVIYRVLLPSEADGLRDDAISSLLYVQNWHLVLAGVPYGADQARIAPYLHLWSLAVEVQLYLCWALLVVVLVGRLRRPAAIWTTLGLAAASALSMALRYSPDSIDAGTPAYYATDTRASGFLLGAALALAWTPREWALTPPRPVGAVLDIAGAVALVLLGVELVTDSEFDPALYQQGGFLRVGLLVVAVITAATRENGRLRVLLAGRPLTWVGRRSYGLYLYHWPVFALVRGAPDQGWPPDLMALAVTFVVAELSYRRLETPIRRGELRAAVRRLGLRRREVALGWLWIVVTVPALAVATTSPWVAAAAEAPPAAAPEPVGPAAGHTLVIGDSIAMGATDALRTALGPETTTMQAAVGRQFTAAPSIVTGWAAQDGGPVVVELGSNGAVRPRDVEALVAAAGGRRLVLVGVAVPRRWRDHNNEVLREAAAHHAPSVVFVDWAALVASHPGSLGPDRVHPTEPGRLLLSGAVEEALRR